jgi:TM2 domain-containing membrane protein YozV
MNTTSTAAETYNYTVPPRISPKSRLVAALLAWLLGPFGGARFYVGKTGSAIALLLISFTFVGLFITIPWALIDLVVILAGGFKDGEGLAITRWKSKQ